MIDAAVEGQDTVAAGIDDRNCYIIGMVPMALGLGEAGEQNAPLGRAVIGGLAFATFGTLLSSP